MASPREGLYSWQSWGHVGFPIKWMADYSVVIDRGWGREELLHTTEALDAWKARVALGRNAVACVYGLDRWGRMWQLAFVYGIRSPRGVRLTWRDVRAWRWRRIKRP